MRGGWSEKASWATWMKLEKCNFSRSVAQCQPISDKFILTSPRWSKQIRLWTLANKFIDVCGQLQPLLRLITKFTQLSTRHGSGEWLYRHFSYSRCSVAAYYRHVWAPTPLLRFIDTTIKREEACANVSQEVGVAGNLWDSLWLVLLL